jgi:phage tail sheath protein FI
VYHFFLNGGQDAYVVRLAAANAATASVVLAPLTITARNPGNWANDYGIVIKARTDNANRFRLAVVYVKPSGEEVTVEAFENLSVSLTDPRNVATVVNADSALVTVTVAQNAAGPPQNTGTPSPKLFGGFDGDVLGPNTGAFETALTNQGNPAAVPPAAPSGIYLLDRVDLFNLLCVPGETTPATVSTLEGYCHDHRAFLIADCYQNATFNSLQGGPPTGITGDNAVNAAFYFPWLDGPDPLQENRDRNFPPCGFVAGIYARTDAGRGVWKAPAGIDASLTAVGRDAHAHGQRERRS